MPETPFNWQCPFCNRQQTVLQPHYDNRLVELKVGKTGLGYLGLWREAIRCLNPDCNELTLGVSLAQVDWEGFNGSMRVINEVQRFQLRPQSYARPWPEFIPQPLRNDYNEACLIRDLSPKASATLARRVLQGMLHDFCNIRERTLFHEIVELERRLENGSAPRGVEE